MRYQHKWEDIDPSEVPDAGQANLEATIHRALELGINHIEADIFLMSFKKINFLFNTTIIAAFFLIFFSS